MRSSKWLIVDGGLICSELEVEPRDPRPRSATVLLSSLGKDSAVLQFHHL